MSDGNYNKNLLPYHNYQSGVRAGRATMRTLAIKAFEQWLRENRPNLPDEEIEMAVNDFRSRL